MSRDSSSPPGDLLPKAQLGAYRIEERLGAGGMGVVYRATDTKLERSVALKVIRPELLHDEGLTRFAREARLLASLNHPHIAAIHGMEESGDIRFLVLEYVPGPTLAERIRRGPVPIREAVSIAKQTAEALEAAHARNIIHRDLKPANIKIDPQGQVKVLDFGLAKSVPHRRTAVDDTTLTMSADLTGEMSVLGTPAYMSPEQATGNGVDAKTDIWAFGCVVYEVLCGCRAFPGASITEILAAVIEREPDWTRLPAEMPETLESLLRRCLRKDQTHRLQDIGDARIELEDWSASPAELERIREPLVTRRTAISTLSGAAAGAAATGVFAISRYRGSAPRNLTQFAIMAPGNGVFVPSFTRRVGMSPDGRYVAFNCGLGGSNPETFYLRSLSELESQRVKVSLGGGGFFSPDSRWLGFITNNADQAIRKVALSGGAPVTICKHDGFSGATWADDGNIYFVASNPGGLMSVSDAGGQPKDVAKIDFANGERQHKYPDALPGQRSVLVTVTTADIATFDEARIVAVDTRTGQRKVLLEGGTHPRFSSGLLLYANDGKILAVPFDPDRLEVQGQPFTALEGVQMSRNTGVANFDVSASGDLAYVSGICDGGARTLVWVDRNGMAEPVPMAPRSYLHPRLSPDDRRLAIEVEGPSHDLYVYDFDRGVLANITSDGVSHWPLWSPDGTQLGYRSGPMGHFRIWEVPADRSRPPQQVQAEGVAQSAESWSPDGGTILYTVAAPGVPPSIMAARLDGSHQVELIDKEKAPEGSPKFSPDGHWLAYCSNESGKSQVYVQAFPGPGPKIQVSTDGGTDPVWKRKGGELYYRNDDSMMAVAVSTAPAFKAARPKELWKRHYSHGMSSSCGPPGATSSNYDATADGSRFLMIKDDDLDRAASRQIVVVLGWIDELRRQGARTLGPISAARTSLA